MWPELLYRLNGADVGTQWLNVRLVRSNTSGLDTSPDVDIFIPEDELWLIYAASIIGTAGAAQVCQQLTISVVNNPPSVTLSALLRIRNLTNQIESANAQFNGMPIRGPVNIRGTGVFDAAVNSNDVALDLNVTRIPRGNWTLT